MTAEKTMQSGGYLLYGLHPFGGWLPIPCILSVVVCQPGIIIMHQALLHLRGPYGE